MEKNFELFNELHHQDQPLLIGNVWDVQSALAFEQAGYKAIATSSAAIAATLGYEDNQSMPFPEYLAVIKRIKNAVHIPFSADIEAGFGSHPQEIAANISVLANAGVAGINIEDSVVQDGERTITDPKAFTKKIQELVALLCRSQTRIFLNLRSDGFLLNLPNALEDAIERVKIYQAAGVHGLFLPGIKRPGDIKAIVSVAGLPINVMCIPGLPDFTSLRNLGVKRISQGPFVHKKLASLMEGLLQRITTAQSFESLF